ncbi:hypothetical protein TraAM80_01598 [Trypanosoma rangeli]|uniref:Uncharacterized protein n=1 Tax=Trypanosoma rangeli TaxID=5698 RepID=A0A422NYC0_TRYRA|nr:uncharacterized protein TraAM80_01598 [Trypanosoma rangeli]RNF10425.1 hypothetical protein TraAM80_01598 [Trypanosoma rangeli]|eukprot:RNF10425.1 hypothetical protein TraAM80_01598 [Trypanosoma rangeli]
MIEVLRSPPDLREIERGLGDWGQVPRCVRDTLVAILESPRRDAPPAVVDDAERTLLPLRRRGPKTDIASMFEAVLAAHRPREVFVPNLQCVVTESGEKLPQHYHTAAAPTLAPAVEAVGSSREYTGCIPCNDADSDEAEYEGKAEGVGLQDCRVREPQLLPDRRVFYGNVLEPPTESPRRDRATSSRGSVGAPHKRRLRVVRPIVMDTPTVKKVECVRHRHEVRDVLLRVHCEIDRLHAEADTWFVKSIYDAMRLDLRRAKDVYGEVKPLPHPTKEQEQALAAFAEGLAVLQEATVELVSTFLSQEEKRFLGVDTHKYQTRTQRSSTYQYAPATGAKRKEQATGTWSHEGVSSTLKGGDVEDRHRARDITRHVASAPTTAKAAAPHPTGAAAAAVVPPPAAASGNNSVREKTGVAAANPSRSTRLKRKSQPKPSQQPPTDFLPRAATASAPSVTENDAALGSLPQLDLFEFGPTPAAPAPATAKEQDRTRKGAAALPPPAPLKKHLSCSTLSTKSSKSAGNRVDGKKEAVAREAAPAPVAPARPSVGLGRIDIKRFLIDSDSDSDSKAT